MPAVRMKHDEHGWTHAYTAEEVAEHEKNGWVVEVPVKAESVVPTDVQTALAEKRKPGRPKGS